MVALLVTIHVLVSLFLIFVILLQPGKGDSMAALGGGGSSSSVFGSRGSVTFLAKVTEVCAAIFMITSLTLAYRSSHSDSVLRARRNIEAQQSTKKSTDDAKKAPAAAPAPAQSTGKAPADAAPKDAPPAAPPAPAPAPAKK
jgi:preprotein translocase subunit SecG